jgi:hypothetical protein
VLLLLLLLLLEAVVVAAAVQLGLPSVWAAADVLQVGEGDQ